MLFDLAGAVDRALAEEEVEYHDEVEPLGAFLHMHTYESIRFHTISYHVV